MDVGFAVLADYASLSQEGKLNVLGIFGEINPPQLPFALPMMYLVLAYEAGVAEIGTDKIVRIVLLDSDGKQLLGLEQTNKVPQAKRPGSRVSVNHLIGLAGIRFDHAGDYAFSVLIGGEEKKSVPLRVNEPAKGGS